MATTPIKMTHRDYVSMADFLGSSIDLSEATQTELNLLFLDALELGWRWTPAHA